MGIKIAIKNLTKKIVYGYYDSDSFIEFLRKKGVTIGKNCKFFAPNTICFDLTRPYGISIGDNVIITQGVTILTHGFDWSVLKNKYSTILGSFGSVRIDNNVFVGINAIILSGVHIQSDVIVGAGSVVTKDLERGFVYAGNPAKKIMSIEEYYNKRVGNQVVDCKDQIQSYKRVYGSMPPETELSEFFYLFSNDIHNAVFNNKLKIGGNYEPSFNMLRQGRYQRFSSFAALLDYCKNNEGDV